MKSSTSVDIEPNSIGGRSATAAGVIIAILGLLAVVFPLITGISVSILLGAVLVVGALVHAANAFSAGTLGNVLGQAVLAVLYGFAGIAFIANPVVGLATLTLLAIAFFLADGLVEIAWGLRSRGQPGTTWLLASGGISLLLAGFLWLGFPSSAGWAIGVLLGVNLLVTGVSMILVGRGTDEPIAPDVPRGSQGRP
jgi:uncharacterized membrane protein HdeD (DUF308 family)